MGRYVFKLPDVGEGTAEAELVAWHVKVGDRVEEDQPLADVMTDKATVELTSPVAGVVAVLNGEVGVMSPVGSPLVELEVEGAGNAPLAAAPAPKAEPVAAAPAVVEEEAVAEPVMPQPDMQGAGDFVFKLPDVGEGTAEAELVAWHVKVGDTVEEDQPLADVMTDKATVELTSPVAGVVVALHGEVGRMTAVGSPLVVLQTKAAAEAVPVQALRREEPRKAEPASKAPAAPAPQRDAGRPQPPRDPLRTAANEERQLASPAVRRRARELGIQLQFVQGSGPSGRIEHRDLDAFIATGGRPTALAPAPAQPGALRRSGVEEVKIIGLRRRIAEKMQEAKRRIPHFMYAEEIDATELEALRVYLNSVKRADQPKLTLLPFFVRALVKVLPQHPQINARYDDDAGVLHRHEAVHCGIATQTPNGLMVPVVRHAESMDVWEIASEIARVSGAAKDGKAAKEELTGSTITVTSLGTLGGVVHTPVINHPEVAIVGPNRIVERPVVLNGQIAVRKMMNLSSSFDHRIVDGYDAATFVQKLKNLLEHPAALFMD
jgi:2-oxoisovalerate dehydrogenase E2 component (dihydrolipoyl transacylase)